MSSRPLILRQGKPVQAQEKQIDASVIEYNPSQDYPEGSLPNIIKSTAKLLTTATLPPIADVDEATLIIVVES